MEFSINYQRDQQRKFRLYFDPVKHPSEGKTEGTNSPIKESAVRDVVQYLNQFQQDIDMTWFDHFDRELGVYPQDFSCHKIRIVRDDLPYDSQTCLGLDLLEESVVVKAYFSPMMKSMIVNSNTAGTMFDAIFKLDHAKAMADALKKVEEFIFSVRVQLLAPEIFVAFDCNDPQRSRLKIYIGWTGMSLQDVRNCWTLGERVKGPEVERGFDIVQEMWHLLYQHEPGKEDKQPLTMVWNWELRPNDPNPAPKAYFGFPEKEDTIASGALTALFAHLGWHDHIESHQSMMKKLQHRSSGYFNRIFKGITRISIAYPDRAGPYISTYSGPPQDETYSYSK
ncbi:Fumigaclavine A dimethylallyltransferase easL [Penicillium rolfsii]|nr:Fumigaclavine A dimethylallyltransferase easL [Penicillium rolfsii]